MLRLTSKRAYKKVPGHRRVYKALEDLLVPGDGNLVFVPKGRKLEVSVLEAAPDTGRPEVALSELGKQASSSTTGRSSAESSAGFGPPSGKLAPSATGQVWFTPSMRNPTWKPTTSVPASPTRRRSLGSGSRPTGKPERRPSFPQRRRRGWRTWRSTGRFPFRREDHPG